MYEPECVSDEEAYHKATTVVGNASVDIWQGDRWIAWLDGKDPYRIALAHHIANANDADNKQIAAADIMASTSHSPQPLAAMPSERPLAKPGMAVASHHDESRTDHCRCRQKIFGNRGFRS